MSTARYLVGDVFDALATIPDDSVDVAITSPPFLALRSYLPADDPLKDKEIGSEATPAAFLDVMLAVTAELRRVLADHGSIAVEFGDTYAGSGGAGGDYGEDGWRDGQERFDGSASRAFGTGAAPRPARNGIGSGWPLAKSRALIPELYRIALAYGHNPLTGQPSPAGKWRIRNVVTWCRPNPPVGALGDKWRPATSDVVVACTSAKRYWDDLATRTEHSIPPEDMQGTARNDSYPGGGGDIGKGFGPGATRPMQGNPAGAPLLDWWDPLVRRIDEAARDAYDKGLYRTGDLFPAATKKNQNAETPGQRIVRELIEAGTLDGGDVLRLTPGGYRGAHYAVFPPDLVVPLVKAMGPQRVCQTCGEPSRREVEKVRRLDGVPVDAGQIYVSPGKGMSTAPQGVGHWRFSTTAETTGWSDCGHDNWRPGHVLDPFAGTGTTLAVATGHGLIATGIDIDHRNADLALERLGMFLDHVEEVTSL